MIVINKYTNHKPPVTVPPVDTAVALCVEKEWEALITQGTEIVRVENHESEIKDTLTPEVLFEVPPTGVGFLLSLCTRYESS